MKTKLNRIAAIVTASFIGIATASSRQPAPDDSSPGEPLLKRDQPDQPADNALRQREDPLRPGDGVRRRTQNQASGPDGAQGPAGVTGSAGAAGSATRAGGFGGSGSGVGPPARAYSDRLQSIIRRSPGGSQAKALVIRPADGQPAEQSELEEDLAIMLHLLDKAVEEQRNDGFSLPRNAMGIDVVFPPGSGSIRSLYLDGYGALFILKVGFPLLPPPLAKPREERPPADSSWEAAKRELQSPGPDAAATRFPGEEFNQEKATRLEDALFGVVKNAVHIRGLKADDTITICVLGGGVRAAMRTGPKPDRYHPNQPRPAEAGSPPGAGDEGGMRTSTLTLRVKKSDVEALTKGKLTPEDFRKRAILMTGVGPATGGTPSGNWMGNLFGGDVRFGRGGGFNDFGGGGGGGVGGGGGGSGGTEPH